MCGHLLLLRHGETFANLEKRLDTRVPGASLTEVGKQQARDWGRKRDPRSLRLIGTSEALRARQTGHEILAGMRKGFPDVPEEQFPQVRIIPGMYETQVGDWEDGVIDDANLVAEWFGLFFAWLKGDWDAASPGPLGESARMVGQRALPQIESLYEEFFAEPGATDQDVVVVAHGAIIPLMTTMLVPGLDKRFAFWSFLNNVDTVQLRPQGRTGDQSVWELVRWGDKEPPFVCDVPEEYDSVEALKRLTFASMGNKAASPQVPGVGTGKD